MKNRKKDRKKRVFIKIAFFLIIAIILLTKIINEEEIFIDKTQEEKIPELNSSNTTIKTDPSLWTNEKISVSISTKIKAGDYKMQYSLDDGKTWHTYIEPFDVEDNDTTIQVRLWNGKKDSGHITGNITNIDRLKPIIVSVNEKHTTDSITISAKAVDSEATKQDAKSGISKYYFSIDGGNTWFPQDGQIEDNYTFEKLDPTKEYDLKVKVEDNAGNVTESESKRVSLLNAPPELNSNNTKIIVTPQTWTNSDVKVEIETTLDTKNCQIQYTIDEKNWINYSAPFYVKNNNTKIYVRLFNGKYSEKYAIGEITNIDRLPPQTVNFNEIHTTNAITLTAEAIDSPETDKDGKSDINKYYFSIDDGKTWFPKDGQQERTYTFSNLNHNQEFNLKVRAFDNAGNQKESETKTIKTNRISDLNENNTKINITPSSWTNTTVNVEILVKKDFWESLQGNYKLQYSTDITNWNDYNGPFTYHNNGTIYTRLWDGINAGNYTTANIVNIDRLSPIIKSISDSHTTNSITIQVDAEDSNQTETDGKSGINKYYFSKDGGANYYPSEGQESNTYTFYGLLQQKEYSIKVKVIDRAGNETISDSKITKTDKVNDLSMSNTEIKVTPSTWTNKQVKVEINTNLYSKDYKEIKLQYSSNGIKWNDYTEPFFVSNNQVVYARLSDGINKGDYTTANISNIDRLPPGEITINENHTSNSIMLLVDVDDSEATKTDGKSGINKFYFSIDNGETYLPEEGQFENVFMFSNLIKEKDYKVKVKVADRAGNIRESQTKLISTDNVHDLNENNTEIKITPSTWTNNDVTVEIKTSVDLTNYKLQFSTDEGETWTNYVEPFNISNDKVTIYARLFDGISGGKNVSKKITNIDRLKPKEVIIESVSTKSNSITVNAYAEDQEENETNGKSGIEKYFFSNDDGMTYLPEGGQDTTTFTFNNLNQNSNYNIKIKAVDRAGNEKVSETRKVKTLVLEDLKDSNTKIIAKPSTWTNGNVMVSIETSVDLTGKLLQYSTNASTWIEYKAPFAVINNNETIFVRTFDGVNEGGHITGNITNIDRLKPVSINVTEIHNTNSITITANAEDAEATEIDGKSDIGKYYFSIDDGKTWTEPTTSNQYTYNKLPHNKDYKVRVKAEDNAGNYIISDSRDVITGAITDLNEENTNIIVEPEEWTNKVTVTIEPLFDLNGFTLEYSTDQIEWNNYQNSFEIDKNNTTIYARLSDGENKGKYIARKIDNIDKLNPIISAVNEIHTSNYISITAIADDHEATETDGKSNIVKYYFSINGGNTWVPSDGQERNTYTFTGLLNNQEYEIMVRAEDKAGNYTDSLSKIVRTNNVITLDESNTTIRIDPSDRWSNTYVEATILTSVNTDGCILQYSTNALDWNEYTGSIKITDNKTTIYARLWDGNNGGQFISKTINNIDKLNPVITSQSEVTTSSSITVVVSAEDQEETKTDGKSEISKYYFSNNNGLSWLPENGQDNGTYTFNGLTQNNQYNILVRVEDNAGNFTYSEGKTVTTGSVPGGDNVIRFVYSNTKWTNKNVYVSIIHTAGIEYKIQYLKDNEWVDYTEPLTMTENGSIIARLIDKSGQVGATATGNVSNIDRDNPTSGEVIMTLNSETGKVYEENTWTNKSVYLKLQDGTDIGGSGIKSTTFKIKGPVTVTDRTEDYMITESGIYIITITTVDNAENTVVKEYTVSIDKIKPIVGTLIMKIGDENGEDYAVGKNPKGRLYLDVIDGTDDEGLSGHKKTSYTIFNSTQFTEKDGPYILTDKGESSITVTTMDNAGNIVTQTYTVVVKNKVTTTISVTTKTMNEWAYSSTIVTDGGEVSYSVSGSSTSWNHFSGQFLLQAYNGSRWVTLFQDSVSSSNDGRDTGHGDSRSIYKSGTVTGYTHFMLGCWASWGFESGVSSSCSGSFTYYEP